MERDNGYTSTLMAELGEWNRLERTFGSVFDPESLRDKHFLKMKLDTYDQLYRRHNGRTMSRDDRAMLHMLRYQRSKLERLVYPGLSARLLHRAMQFFRSPIDQKAEMQMATQETMVQYAQKQLPAQETQRQKQRYGQDMGRRHDTRPHHGKRTGM